MDNRIKETFGTIQTPERLMRKTKANLRKATFDYGRNLERLRAHRIRLAAGLLSLMLLVSAGGLWFLPASSIAVDINPSLELKVNALDRVIALEGRNADGVDLVRQIDVVGMPYDDAMQRILLSDGMEPYLEKGGQITITVAGGDDAHTRQILSRVLCRAYNIASEERVVCYQVDWETVRAAREAGLCIPRYLAWQQLLEEDPSVTLEDVKQLPKEQIHQMVQMDIMENPCGE